MIEKELQERMVKYLKKFFFVESEVYSTDNKCRIDLIIIHHSDKEKKYPIGIEIKLNEKKRGKDLANWIKQSSEYSKKEFKGYGKCLIITCPQISGLYLREGIEMSFHEIEGDFGQANNVGTFLGQFGLGEFQKFTDFFDKKKFRIVYKGFIIWSEKDNILRFHNYDKLVR